MAYYVSSGTLNPTHSLTLLTALHLSQSPTSCFTSGYFADDVRSLNMCSRFLTRNAYWWRQSGNALFISVRSVFDSIDEHHYCCSVILVNENGEKWENNEFVN